MIGRLGKVEREDLANDPNLGTNDLRAYQFNDLIGRTGLELLCEPTLRGTRGRVINFAGDATQEIDRTEPVPGADGWFQHWTLPGGEVVPEGCAVAVKRGGEESAFVYGKDFVDLSGSGAGEIEAPVVFAGYGISAPEMKYDDYAGVDVRGKVVLILRHEPGERDPESRWNGDSMTRHSGFLFKAMAIFLLVTWVRWSFVRIRVDQILALSWKALLPATLALLVVTAAVVVWRT